MNVLLVSLTTLVLIASNSFSFNTLPLLFFKLFILFKRFFLIRLEPLYNFNVLLSIKSVFFCNVFTLFDKSSILEQFL